MRGLFLVALLGIGCHRAPTQAAPAAMAPVLSDPDKQVALRDLQQDVAAARAAIAAGKSPVYACERAAVAAHELAGEHDEGILKLLADAETVYGREGPVAWADAKMKEVETNPAVKVQDCGTIKEMLNHVNAKFQSDVRVIDLVKRYKGSCPRTHSGGSSRGERSSSSGSGSSGSSAQNLSAQRADCRSRCDRAAWDCSSRCQFCGSCNTSMTWDQCNNICNNCKQGCDQNERFCKSACGD
jgi:hypothetical protein